MPVLVVRNSLFPARVEMYCTVHTHSHSHSHRGMYRVSSRALLEKDQVLEYPVCPPVSQAEVSFSFTHSHSHTHTNYSTVHVLYSMYIMVERNHTPDTHATHALNLQLQSLEGGVPFHTLFVPYVSYHHTQHSPISSPFTSLRFQHTPTRALSYTYNVQ